MSDPVNDPFAAAEAELFGDTVSCEEELPALFVPGRPSRAASIRIDERAEALLRTLATIEDGGFEDGDEHGAHDPPMQRMDAKLNLLIDLVGALARRHSASLPLARVRWSRRGMCLSQSQSVRVAAGDVGTVSVQPTPMFPQRLELPAEAIAIAADPAGQRLWLRTGPLSPALSVALERHLFRLHRRAVARRHR